MRKKLSKAERDGEIIYNAWKLAKLALKNGLGPAHNNNKDFAVIPGKVEDNEGYVIVVEIGKGPVDWYSWSPKPNFLSGFGGWYNYDYNDFIEENPWIEEEWDSLIK